MFLFVSVFLMICPQTLNAQKYRAKSSSSHKNTTVRHSTSKNTSGSHSNAKWSVNSVEELERKIKGTIWTVRPSNGDMWYRLAFHNGTVSVYYSYAQFGKWRSYPSDYTYYVKELYDHMGRKIYSVQITENNDRSLSYGALFFNKYDRDIASFSWARGKQYAAKNEDFQWK